MPTDQQDEKATHDPAKWLVATEIAKFEGDWTGEQIDAGEAPEPFEVLRDEGNLLLIGGVSTLWETLIGNGTGTGGSADVLQQRERGPRGRDGLDGGGGHADARDVHRRGVEGDGRDLSDAHGFDGDGRVEDDHVPLDVRERGREPGVERVGCRQRHPRAEPQGGGERHEGQRPDVAVHRDTIAIA
jgi:hypothetical protein